MALLRRTLGGALLACAAAATAGCEIEPTALPYSERHVAVHAVLAAGDDSVCLYASRFDISGDYTALTGATVRLGLPSGASAALQELRGTDAPCGRLQLWRQAAEVLACYAAALPQRVQAGGRYRLEMVLPGGERVSGETVVPAPPELLAPAPASRFPVRNGGEPLYDPESNDMRDFIPVLQFGVRWRAPGPGAAPEVGLALDTVYRDGKGHAPRWCTGNSYNGGFHVRTQGDSATAIVRELRCPEPPSGANRWDSIAARVLVTAYDSAYVRYAADMQHPQRP